MKPHPDPRETEFDHKDLIASLSAEEREIVLRKSDRAGLMRLAGHLGAIAFLTVLILLRVPYYPVVMLLQGILIVFLFTTLHETIHRTAFRSPRLNDLVATACGFLVFLPPDWFRYFHFAHHRHTHDPDLDPELATPKPDNLGRYLLAMTGIPEWISRIRIVIHNAVVENSDTFVPPKGRNKVRTEARLFCAAYVGVAAVCLWTGWSEIFMIWLVPIVLGGPFLRIYLLAEHTLCPHVANMLENTRTTYTMAIVRFFAWNMPYHIEHHAYPAVPFHRLPVFHRIAATHLGCTEQGYVRFNARYLREIA